MPGSLRRKPKPPPRSIKGDSQTIDAVRSLKKQDDPLTTPVRMMLLKRALQDDAERPTDVIHPSELCRPDWCSRRAFYKIRGVAESNPQKLNDRTLVIYEEGHFIHDKWTTWWWDLGMLQGIFKCRGCGWREWAHSPTECPSCHLPRWALKYMEVPIVNERLMISGRADAMTDELVEIKSVGPGTFRMYRPTMFKQYHDREIALEEMWKSLKRPFVEHIRQGMFYAWLIDRKVMRFLYEWKPYQGNKSFTVRVNESYIADMVESAEDTAYHIRSDRLPPRPRAAEDDDKFCKGCPYLDHCWSKNRDTNSTPTITRTIRRTPGG